MTAKAQKKPRRRPEAPRKRRLLAVPPDVLTAEDRAAATRAAEALFDALEAGAADDVAPISTYGWRDLLFAGQVAAELDGLVATKLRERLRRVDQETQQYLLCLSEGPTQARIDRDAEDAIVAEALRTGPLAYAEIDQRTKLGARLRAVLVRLRRTKRVTLLPHDRYALPETAHG